MESWNFIVPALLLLADVHSLFPDEFRPSSPGFHRRKLSKVGDTSGFRLPGTATPNSYNLSLNLNISENNASLIAQVLINLNVTQANDKNNLVLNSDIQFNNETDTFIWNQGTNTNQNCTLAESESGSGSIKIKCDNPIIGDNQSVVIAYTPTLSSDEMKGVYLVRYKEDDKQKILITTQFEEDSARRLFPSFDEPAYKAKFILNLNTTGNVDVSDWISNTEKVTPELNPENSISDSQTTFAETPKMSTYLLAFVATQDFVKVPAELENPNYSFEIFVRSSAGENVKTALTYGPMLIDKMGELTSLTYESLGITKMSLAGIPEFAAGAMENWGLITFRETYLIDEGNQTTNKDTQLIVEVIAHELAHQWFGDYVTINWWSETWLNEGFAEFFEYYLTDQIFSEYEMLYQLVIKEQQVALKADAYPDSIPLSNNASDVTTDDDLSLEFGDISYSKGASIVKMLRYALGDDQFAAGLNKYLTSKKNDNANSSDLLEALQPVGDGDLQLDTVFKEWIYSAGYPILDVALDETNNVTITARKFSSSLNKSGEETASKWWIPLTYTTDKESDFNVSFQWTEPEKIAELRIPIQNDSWILFNLQASGFYRVNYDQTLLDRLIQVLNNSETVNQIHVVNRAQLLDDVFNIARSQDEGATDYYLNAFRLAEYLQFESEYHPWYTFFTEMQFLLDRIQDTDSLVSLKDKILDIVRPQLNLSKLIAAETHTQVLRSNLILAWACKLQEESCVEWALNTFQSYQRNSTSINNNFRDTILCTALSSTDTTLNAFNTVYDLLDSNLPLEQKDLALSFSCLSNETSINEVLNATLNATDPPFSRMVYENILSGLASDPQKISIVLQFALDYKNAISEAWKLISTPEKILSLIASKIYSEDYNQVINDYITAHRDDEDQAMVETATSAIATISNNVKWVQKYGEVLNSVLVPEPADNTTTTTTQKIETTTSAADWNRYQALLVSVLLPILHLVYFNGFMP